MKKVMPFKPILFLLLLQLYYIGSYGQTKIIATGEEWQYYDGVNAPTSGWEKYTNETNSWKTGGSPLGYGEDFINTTIGFGEDPEDKHITKYFKKRFRIENPFAFLIYKLNVLRDDGIVLYLNGYEIMRDNMPDGTIKHDTKASDLILHEGEERITYTKLLSPNDFVTGINTISASVHQVRSTSSDCVFNLELIGDNSNEMIPLLLREQTIKNLNLDIKVKELNFKQELEKKELQLDFLNQTKNSFKIGLYAISIMFLGSLILLFYLYNSNRKKKTSLSNTVEKLKQINLNKDRDLLTSSLKTLQEKQFLRELKDNLSSTLDESLGAIKKEVEKTIRKIDYNTENDDDWINLINHFNSVNLNYLDNLKNLHPSLSETELRHCIFIKLRMGTKEIANILHIDPKSVQASRYRLKKKMNLDEGTDLRDYLYNL